MRLEPRWTDEVAGFGMAWIVRGLVFNVAIQVAELPDMLHLLMPSSVCK